MVLAAALGAAAVWTAPAGAVPLKWLNEVGGLLFTRVIKTNPSTVPPPKNLDEVLPGVRRILEEYGRAAGEDLPEPEKLSDALYTLLSRAGATGSLAIACPACVSKPELPGEDLMRASATLSRLDIATLDALTGTGLSDAVLHGLNDGKVVSGYQAPVPGAKDRSAANRAAGEVAEFFEKATAPLAGRKIPEAEFDKEVLGALDAQAKASKPKFAIEKVEISAKTWKASFHLKAGSTEIDLIDVDLARVLERLKYLAYGAGGVYLFGPEGQDRDSARAEKAREMVEQGIPARTSASRHIAWARELAKITRHTGSGQ
ncbi:hypothetical protein [Breoghania sp. L-A4]|uniref:hypothetical protein n=1 Tax=Breoghania sp. L-A4 TaxID=2304600 RepID=UPI0013C303DD|nr:hypothetical protein [Breoghania sp. L-A4]